MTVGKAMLALLALLALPSISALASEAATTDPAEPNEQRPLVTLSGRKLDRDVTQRQAVEPSRTSTQNELPVCNPAQVLKQAVEGVVKLVACRSSNAACPGQGLERPRECVLAKGKL